MSDERKTIEDALSGDLNSVEALLASVKDQIFNLALRFLWDPDDAEDATQEILLKILMNLNRFEFRSRFSTWTYRIAMNHLIDAKRSKLERLGMSFSIAGRRLDSLPDSPQFQSESDPHANAILAHQVKTGCTHAMLQCLDRPARAAFILGAAFGMHSEDAAYVLGVSAEAYRQRLSRARGRMQSFLGKHCGLMSKTNRCRCEGRAAHLEEEGLLNRFLCKARTLETKADAEASVGLPSLDRLAWIYRTNSRYKTSPALLNRVRRALQPLSDT